MPSENKMKASDKALIDLYSVFHGGGPEEAASVCAHCWLSMNSTPAWQVSGIHLKDRSGVYNVYCFLVILNDSVEGTVFAQTSYNSSPLQWERRHQMRAQQQSFFRFCLLLQRKSESEKE